MILDLCPWYKNIVKVIVNRSHDVVVISSVAAQCGSFGRRVVARAAVSQPTKRTENGTDSHHGVRCGALSFLNHCEVAQIPPDRDRLHTWAG